jgi:hypothetical protein
VFSQQTSTPTLSYQYYNGFTGSNYRQKTWATMNNFTLTSPVTAQMPVEHLVTLLVDFSASNWFTRAGVTPRVRISGPTINLTTYPIASLAILALQEKGVTVTVLTAI